jgi:hypothetical protein
MLILTIGIVIVYAGQYRQMKSSGQQTDRLIAEQKKIANLEYVARSPNLRVNELSLYHTDDGKIWGYVRVRNDGSMNAEDVVASCWIQQMKMTRQQQEPSPKLESVRPRLKT